MREEELHIIKHASPNEVGSVQGLFNHELLCVPEGETGYFRKNVEAVQCANRGHQHTPLGDLLCSTTYMQVVGDLVWFLNYCSASLS